jgi:hypothetical protein
MKVTVFRDFVACELIEIDRRFRGVYCPSHESCDDDPDDRDG